MTFDPGYIQAEALELMTLCAFGALAESPLFGESVEHQEQRIRSIMARDLAIATYATAGKWTVAWGPGLSSDRANMMYVAKNAANQYAVVIRGTNVQFIRDVLEDAAVFKAVPFPYVQTPDPGIEISQGSMIGLNTLTSLMSVPADGTTTASLTVLQYFMQESSAKDIDVFVTGHSLGGCLASVLAVWLNDECSTWKHTTGSIDFKVYTFAGPTAGNAAFADYYTQQFQEKAIRIYNDHDIVPMAWQSLAEIKANYVPGPGCPWILNAGIDVVDMLARGYAQPGIAVKLSGAVNPTLNTFSGQVIYQHEFNTYLQLLGAPSVELISGINT